MKQTPESQPLTVAGRLYEVGSEADFPELVAGFVAIDEKPAKPAVKSVPDPNPLLAATVDDKPAVPLV